MGGRVPDFRGLFLRGIGGNAAPLGIQQGDAIRNITGAVGYFLSHDDVRGSGVFGGKPDWGYGANEGGGYFWNMMGFSFDASRQVPTADENRPINKAVRYLVRALP